MPVILIALIGGLVVAAAVGIYNFRHPSARRSTTDGTPLIVIGTVFLVWGVVSLITRLPVGYAWAPIGIIFLAVGLRRRRRHRERHL